MAVSPWEGGGGDGLDVTMAVCGLVITLSEIEQATSSKVLAELGWLTLGEQQRLRLPAVMEPRDRQDFRHCWDALLAVDGVVHLDLVYVDYESDEARWDSGEQDEHGL